MVVKGVGKHFRRSFKTWEEKAIPRTIIEITSEKTWREDLGDKRDVYEALGVVEYFVFDPEGTMLNPPLQGWRLEAGQYVSVPLGSDGGLVSDELGLRLIPEGFMLRLVNARTGEKISTREERADRADALAAEVDRLRRALSGDGGAIERE